jgi:hypothetical protein
MRMCFLVQAHVFGVLCVRRVRAVCSLCAFVYVRVLVRLLRQLTALPAVVIVSLVTVDKLTGNLVEGAPPQCAARRSA